MSMRRYWKRIVREKPFRRMGILQPHEFLADADVSVDFAEVQQHIVHIQVNKFIFEGTARFGFSANGWCQLDEVGKHHGAKLVVQAHTPGPYTCSKCDHLLVSWLKERKLVPAEAT